MASSFPWLALSNLCLQSMELLFNLPLLGGQEMPELVEKGPQQQSVSFKIWMVSVKHSQAPMSLLNPDTAPMHIC
eukprot:7217238-Karenia_brevis.AAC.1